MKKILFDLDGTLLHMDQDEFVKVYFGALTKFYISKGYNGDLFLDTLKKAVFTMYKNTGEMSNEDLFFSIFCPPLGVSKEEMMPLLEEFYTQHFPKVAAATCTKVEGAREALDILKEKGYEIYILTNPLFPRLATLERMRVAGINLDDIKHVTTYEDYHYAKPNPQYFKEAMDRFGIKAEETMMFGNDTEEDVAITKLGVPLYLITDDLINKNSFDINSVDHGTFKDFVEFVKELPEAL